MVSTDNGVYSLARGIAYQRAGTEVFVVTTDNRLHDIRDAVGIFVFFLLEQNALPLLELTKCCLNHFDADPDVAQSQIKAFLENGVAKGLFTRSP